MKYVNTDIVFQEIPDEVTLAINISGCPCRCPGCHSTFLWGNKGEELTTESLDRFVERYGNDITCISFMGGDANPEYVDWLAAYLRFSYPQFKTAWWTGRVMISPLINKKNFDYIKVGPYIAHLGPLNSRTTNQRLYSIDRDTLKEKDLTSRFWKK